MTRLLPDLVRAKAQEDPAVAAVVAGSRILSRGDVDAQSNRLARLLREFGCKREDRVCLLPPTGAEAVVAMLGALKADLIFAPLPEEPVQRIPEMLRSCEPVCVLTTAARAGLVDRLLEQEVLRPDVVVGILDSGPIPDGRFTRRFRLSEASQQSPRALPSRSRASSPACVVFPSAAALPGVVWTHASILRFVTWVTQYFGIRTGDRHALLLPLSQDWSLCQTMSGLAGGATVILVPDGAASDPRNLASFIRRSRLTQWSSPFGLLKAMAEADVVGPGDLPSLRDVVFWGPEGDGGVTRYWRTRLGRARFTTLFGVPETTMASAYYTVSGGAPERAGQPPLGVDCPGQRVLVLGPNRQPVQAGETGEVHVSGTGLSPGYWRNPEATKRAFWERTTGTGRRDRSFHVGLVARRGADGQIYPVDQPGGAS